MPSSAADNPTASKVELFDLVVRTAPDGIVTAGADGLIRSFSPAAERMFGYAEAEVVGRNLSILMTSPHAERHDRYMARYLETGEARIIGIGREVTARRKNGETFAVDLAVGELRTADVHIFTGFIRDASARKAAQSRARTLRRELDRLARVQVVGEMATALAHELNQPLSAVANFARAAAIALDRGAEAKKAKAYLDRIAEQSNRAGEIMRRMRQLVDRGAAELRPDDINEIVREAVRASETAPDDVILAVRLHLKDGLPKVLVDRIQIQQVIVNLLRNAQEAMEENEALSPEIATAPAPAEDGIARVEGMVGIEMRAVPLDDGGVLVTVADTGPGVPDDMLETIFDPLVTTKPDGAGVGLAICRSIIHAHGGRIWAENNAHGGTDVNFTLQAAS